MLRVKLDEQAGIATLEVSGRLDKSDFEWACDQIDPLIEKQGKLAGLMIHAEYFPGWDSFGAMISHLAFIRDHHNDIGRIALVTDSHTAGVAEKIGGHFIAAEIKGFAHSEMDAARQWIIGDKS